jgi:hypothetical protein
MAHQRATDESINIDLIHHHVNNKTPSGDKIIAAFSENIPLSPIFDSTVESGANRNTHHDLQIKYNAIDDHPEILKTVEFKGSKHFKPIDDTKPPWFNGVQFYNGTGSKFTIGQKYARQFYDTMLDEIISHYEIQAPKPSYEIWEKDAFKQGRPTSEFVCELRQKGYLSEFLSNCRKKFNKTFISTTMDLIILMEEVQKIASDALTCKDYWLQIHGDINSPDMFYVKWSNKVATPEIIEIEQIISKSDCDINFKFTCKDGVELFAKMRWGYGQCISNIRIDIK